MKLYRAFMTVGAMTMISRVLGFIRDILIASVLGTGLVADAFFVAFRFPNLFRRLFAEGAFNAAFVPLFAKKLVGEHAPAEGQPQTAEGQPQKAEGQSEKESNSQTGLAAARRFAEDALSVLLTTLLIVTALAEILMPWLMHFIAPGFSDNAEKFDLAIVLTRIAFPYLLCMSLVALFSGALNALGRFAAAAAAPIALNIVLIGFMLAIIGLGHGNSRSAGVILAWGVAFAGVVQLVLLIIAARRADIGLSLRWPKLTPDVKRLVRLGIPGVIAGGITQINLLVGTIIASLQDSAVSYLYYADRIYQLPLGVVGIAIGIVLLPDLARQLRSGDEAAVHNSQNRSLEFSLLLTLPASVALFVIAAPIIQVLFERGAFTSADTAATAQALAAFAWGLPAFVLIKVFSPGFFAREDTKTPMIYAGISMAVNIAGSLLLFGPLGFIGIAVATSLAGWINALLLMGTLYRRGHYQSDQAIRRRGPAILIASLIMGAGLWFGYGFLEPWFGAENGLWMQIGALAVLIGGGALLYGLAAQLTGAAHLPSLLADMRRGKRAG